MELTQSNQTEQVAQDITITESKTSAKEQSLEQAQLQNFKKAFFTAAQQTELEECIGNAQTICDANQKTLMFNWDTEKDKIPEGYEFLVAPRNQRMNNTTVVTGIGVGAIPSYDLLIKSDAGLAFVKSSIQAIISAKFLNALRPNKSGDLPATIPFTIDDFVTVSHTEGTLSAYRKLSTGFIKLLKEKNFEYLIEPTFRQCLQSAAYAETAYPVPQTVWHNIIKKMIKIAEEEGMQAGQLAEWLDTRDSAGMPKSKEINLEGLEELGV